MIWELKALACLLLYPDDDLLESLPEIDEVLQKSEELGADSKRQLDEFVAWIKWTDLTSLQSAYVIDLRYRQACKLEPLRAHAGRFAR